MVHVSRLRRLLRALACGSALLAVLLPSVAAAAPSPVRRIDVRGGVFAIDATSERVLVAAQAFNVRHPKSLVRLDAYSWTGTAVKPVPFQITCGAIWSDSGPPAFSLHDAGGLIALRGEPYPAGHFQGGVMLAGSRHGNAICGEFYGRETFAQVRSTGTRLLETLPPRRECVDGTRAATCPLVTPIVSLNARARVTVAKGAFTLVAASGELAVGYVSSRARELPRVVGLDLRSGVERWARPVSEFAGGFDQYTLFGATDGALVALSVSGTLLLLDAHTGATMTTWHNMHIGRQEIGLARGLVSWFGSTSSLGGHVYVREAAGTRPPRVIATLPHGWTEVDLRLTSRGLAWAATRLHSNGYSSIRGAVWTVPWNGLSGSASG
jgi:hypothetical protein